MAIDKRDVPRDTSEALLTGSAQQFAGALENLAGLGRFFWPQKRIVIGVLLLVSVSSLAQLVIPFALGDVIDKGFGSDEGNRVDFYFYLFFAIVFVFAIATFGRRLLVIWLGERVVVDVRRRVYDHLLGFSADHFDRMGVGTILARLTNDIAVLHELVAMVAPAFLRFTFLSLGGTLALFVVSPKLAFLLALVLPLLCLTVMIGGRVVRQRSRETQDRLAEVVSLAEETLGAIETSQAFVHEQADREQYGSALGRAYRAAMRRAWASASVTGIIILLSFSLINGVLWIGAKDLLAGGMTGGELTSFVFLALMAARGFAGLSDIWSHVFRAGGATERVMELLATEPTIQSPPVPVPLPKPVRGEIRFDGVSFSYPARPEVLALQDFNLHIAPGQKVALVGPSGSGKTTVFNLILRFYDPQQGTVTIDGVDLRAADLREVRSAVSLVPQDPVLFSGDVLENIRYGRPDARDDEVLRAAEVAEASEFVHGMPQAFQTQLGPRGRRLSGGQTQRLAIARAVLRDSRILLLDEATSAVDTQSERLLQAAIAQLTVDRTTLFISHRLSSIAEADQIVVMERGRVVAVGSHRELMEQGGLYARLARLQFFAEDAVSQTPGDRDSKCADRVDAFSRDDPVR